MGVLRALGLGFLSLAAGVPGPALAQASSDEAMLVDGQCRQLVAGDDDVTSSCRSAMRIESDEDGATRVRFEADGVAVEFFGGGRTAVLGSIRYLMIERVTIERSGASAMVATGEGSCAQSGAPGGPLHVRCVMLDGAVAEFMTDGTPPRRP